MNYYVKRGNTRVCIVLIGEWAIVYRADCVLLIGGGIARRHIPKENYTLYNYKELVSGLLIKVNHGKFIEPYHADLWITNKWDHCADIQRRKVINYCIKGGIQENGMYY